MTQVGVHPGTYLGIEHFSFRRSDSLNVVERGAFSFVLSGASACGLSSLLDWVSVNVAVSINRYNST